MTPDDAYAALNHLRSVLRVPRRDEANKENLELFQKSFMDYISDFRRSGFSHDIEHEAQQLMAQCAFRILNEAPDGIDFGDVDYGFFYGTLRRGPGTGAKISVTWPVDDHHVFDNIAIDEVAAGMDRGNPTFQNEVCIRILSTWFEKYHDDFPFVSLRKLAFDESRRQEFMMHGTLKQMLLKAVKFSTSWKSVRLQFRRPATAVTNFSDPWNSSCPHKRTGKWGERDNQDWKTSFQFKKCKFCTEQFERQLKDWKARSPDHVVPILFTSTGWCCVEFRFVDPKDGISEWAYQFWVFISLKERKKYGSDL
ncbi:hypothetical protein AGABI1DRAFT_95514 [Agaricus bisporus var. burnettii JB137-S8]|uniref:Uncharacterized protein n=1 Tax=Agaricus bisporus var. burnettii (strain JB137-S8 / ATCC MYA-4627 / FGSC 10392) TaxID=597362 RepID=K5WV37_AGABU|nr:uncharacterized protein AGABI1DRAFT_95514 [Agaricus bisporus var. burnettii JB137-S8]EKM74623.1 hypothetical protein AGABI1DRAFT_95514 [Agaricus bisporus var. burnettii JB137-S8]